MIDFKETSKLDDTTGKMVVTTTYDNSAVLEANRQERIERQSGKYKRPLAHVGRIHMGDIVRLRNQGYDLLSSDPDEIRRALLHIQTNEPHLLTVEGKPFAKKRPTWR